MTTRRRVWLAAATLLAVLAVGAGLLWRATGRQQAAINPAAGSASVSSGPATPPAISPTTVNASTWSGLRPCSESALAGYQCGTLTVPLDRTAGAPDQAGTLDLPVVVGGNLRAARTLLLLTGGPGQPGVSLAARLIPRFEGLSGAYRLVMFDQRGTGGTALDCPRLQEEIGFSDLEIPTDAAVAECARALGAQRAQYGTTATVADMEDLRAALHADRWSIDGVSYGSYVAQRYAGAHRDRVDRLVLDSVVPVQGFDPTMVDAYPEVAQVLRAVCRETSCPGDPADNLAAVVRRSSELGPRLLDVLSVMSVVHVQFDPVPEALHAAAGGDEAQLRGVLDTWQRETSGPASALSQGLHASALCLDLDFPWGGADAPAAGRAKVADAAVARLSAARLWPFDARTARTNGLLRTCELWPPEPDTPVPTADLSLRGVHALILRGDRDLSTLAVWAERVHRAIPGSRLLVVPGVGHSVQGASPEARQAVIRYLLGQG